MNNMGKINSIYAFVKSYWKALRVFSLSLAAAAVALGAAAAYEKGYLFSDSLPFDIFLLIIVIIAGIASQAGANLINDYFEGSFKYPDPSSKQIRFFGRTRTLFHVFVFLSGIAALGLAGLIGLYLIYITDWKMLVIGLLGLAGSYAYTGEPFVYKRKGLGVPLSFILMGPLMLEGAWYAFAETISWFPVIIGLPASFFVPALMVSNEMRDLRRDTQIKMGTLCVRLGYKKSLALYDILTFCAFLLVPIYIFMEIYPLHSLLCFAALPAAFFAKKHVANLERASIPYTNRVQALFSALLILSFILSWL